MTFDLSPITLPRTEQMLNKYLINRHTKCYKLKITFMGQQLSVTCCHVLMFYTGGSVVKNPKNYTGVFKWFMDLLRASYDPKVLDTPG